MHLRSMDGKAANVPHREFVSYPQPRLLVENDTSEALFGPGLMDAMIAEIHAIFRLQTDRAGSVPILPRPDNPTIFTL